MEMHRSKCPINLVVEAVGDKWTFLILRDMMLSKRRHFNELLRNSEEGIASNILRDRLATMEKEGFLTRAQAPDQGHKQKITYSLTEKAIDLLPLMMAAISWSVKYQPVDKEKYTRAITLMASGPAGLEKYHQQLLEEHGVTTI